MNAPRFLVFGETESVSLRGWVVNPAADALPSLCAGASLLLWWAVGVPLADDSAPMLVEDHIRLLACTPALTGPHFVPMHDPYDLALAQRALPALRGEGWSRGVVADVPHALALSAAEKAMLRGMGARWAVAGPTAATVHARRRGLPVVAIVSNADSLRELVGHVDLAHALGDIRLERDSSC